MIAQNMPVGGLSLVTENHNAQKAAVGSIGQNNKGFVLLFITFLFLITAAPAYAGTGLGDFFSWFTGWAEDVHHAFTNDVPSMFERMYAWLVYWATYMKITLMISSIEFSWGVAKVILDDFGWTAIINSLLTSLPPDTQALISALKLPTAFEWVLTAYITRFVRSAI